MKKIKSKRNENLPQNVNEKEKKKKILKNEGKNKNGIRKTDRKESIVLY